MKTSNHFPKHGLTLWNRNVFFTCAVFSSPHHLQIISPSPNYLPHPNRSDLCITDLAQTQVFQCAQSCGKTRNTYNHLNNWWWVISCSRTESVVCVHYFRTLMNIWTVPASEEFLPMFSVGMHTDRKHDSYVFERSVKSNQSQT